VLINEQSHVVYDLVGQRVAFDGQHEAKTKAAVVPQSLLEYTEVTAEALTTRRRLFEDRQFGPSARGIEGHRQAGELILRREMVVEACRSDAGRFCQVAQPRAEKP
jgi:hypothetical protein